MKFISSCLILSLLLVIPACAGLQRGNDPKLLATADFGDYPENLKEIVKAHLNKVLFDPYSVRDLTIKKPKQSWYRPSGFRQSVIYGYETRVSLNAKNRMGGYTGIQEHFVFVRNGQIIVFSKWEDMFKYAPDDFNTMPDKMSRPKP